MKRQARARCLVVLAVALVCSMTPQQLMAAETQEARIPFALPTLKADKMPPVFFSHDKHVAWMENADKDCFVCHVDGSSGMSEYFMNSEKMPVNKVVPYIHRECVACHASIASNKPTGPPLASCRSCHVEGTASAQAGAKKP